jgi:hypothetical protein
MKSGHQRAYCSFSMRYISMKNHGGMTLRERKSLFVHQSSLEILPSYSSSMLVAKQEEVKKDFF